MSVFSDRSHRWEQVAPLVYRLCGSALSPLTWPMTGLLAGGPGAHVSHGSAATLWGWNGFRPFPVEVQRPKGTNAREADDWLRIHESRRLPSDDLAVLDGITLPTPSRLLIDLSFDHPKARIERWLEWAWSRRQLSSATVLAACERMGRKGVRGVVWLEEMIAERGDEYIPPASGLESRVASILRFEGLGSVERQTDLGDTSWIGRTDLLHRSGVVLEVQSELHHAALAYQRDDQLRFARLREAGFDVVEVWEGEVWSTSRSWVERFRHAIRERKSRVA